MPNPPGHRRQPPPPPPRNDPDDWIPVWLQVGLTMTLEELYWDDFADGWIGIMRVAISHPRHEQPTVYYVRWLFDATVVAPDAAPAA